MVTIKLLTPLYVGGEPGEDTNTLYILRGVNDKAYYPGTAFKGKVRYYAREFHDEACNFPNACDCRVCKLFGGEGNARGSLFFSDLYSNDDQTTDLRTGNSIDRYRRVAKDEMLYSIETADIRKLRGFITGSADDYDIRLLKNSIKLIKQIGGNTSRGLGWVVDDITLNEIQINERLDANFSGTAKQIHISLKPVSPLLIGTHTTQSNFRDTQCVIPGSVMRAAFARSICEIDGTSDASKEGIVNILPDDKLTLFPNMRNELSKFHFSTLHTDIQKAPYPLTMRKCKFIKTHKKIDLLAALLNGEDKSCPECGGRLDKVEAFEDFFNSRDDLPKRTITSTHSEIDKFRGTTKDKRLYTIRAIAPGEVVFEGTVSGNIDLSEISVLFQNKLRIGAKITSGFGECEVDFEPVNEKLDDNLMDRIKKFIKLINGRYLIPITLMSDAIVALNDPGDNEEYDYLGAYEYLFTPFKLEYAIVNTHIWRGFDTSVKGRVIDIQKYMLQAGSVFVIKADITDDLVINKLIELERCGIGNNKEDGYGSIRIAHEAHI